MPEIIPGDKKFETIPSIKDKALRINLNENIWYLLHEIGAGGTVRNFFRAGGASGTIAKTMSAYDKDFSDAIYGGARRLVRNGITGEKGCWTTKSNWLRNASSVNILTKCSLPMPIRWPLSTLPKKYKGHGWFGIKFQLDPTEAYSEIIAHPLQKETEAILQQQTLGILGWTHLWCGFTARSAQKLLRYLYDHIDKG